MLITLYGHFVSGQHCAGGRGGEVLPRFGMLENSPKTVKCVITFETDCWSSSSVCRVRFALTAALKCQDHKTCQDCHTLSGCGWCDDGSRTGLGRCVEGGDDGPSNRTGPSKHCPADRWHFVGCPGISCRCFHFVQWALIRNQADRTTKGVTCAVSSTATVITRYWSNYSLSNARILHRNFQIASWSRPKVQPCWGLPRRAGWTSGWVRIYRIQTSHLSCTMLHVGVSDVFAFLFARYQ